MNDWEEGFGGFLYWNRKGIVR